MFYQSLTRKIPFRPYLGVNVQKSNTPLLLRKNYISEDQVKSMTELIVTCTKCHKFMEQTTDNTIYWLCPNCGISIGITIKTDD